MHEEALTAAGVRADGTIDINAALRALLEGLLDAVMDKRGNLNLILLGLNGLGEAV